MLDKLKHINPFVDKRFAVIGVTFGEDIVYEGLIIERKGEQLTLGKRFVATSIDKIKDNIEVSTPVILNFSGKGIISKKVKLQGNYLKEVLFNASPDNFYIYDIHQGSDAFISLGRKTIIDEVFEEFKEKKFIVIDYSIGDFVGLLIKRILAQESIISRETELFFVNDILESYKKTEERDNVYLLGEERLQYKDVPLFATMLNHLYPVEEINYEIDELIENRQEAKLKKIFETVVIAVGIFFLSTLLISYLLLNYYNDQYVTYESQLFNLNHTYNQVKKLEEEKQNKALVLNESGILKDKFLSYYISQIAETVPKEISLEILSVNPVIKKIKALKKIGFEGDIITITGTSVSSISLNTWVKRLKKQDWVSQLEILDFSNKRRKNGEFTIKINVK